MPPPNHILVVEDDPDMLDVELLLLESAGYEAEGARNGDEALRAVEHQMPDLILLDMLMPVMDGWQFAHTFHERYGHAAPIVVTTAAEHARERAQAIGADDVLSKPFDVASLVDTVGHFVPPDGRASAAGHPEASHPM